MDKDLRASLIASGAAAALSAIVGALYRAPFFVLALRALLGGLVIGAFVYGALWAMRRFLPELFAVNGDAVNGDAADGDAADGDAADGDAADAKTPRGTASLEYAANDDAVRGEFPRPGSAVDIVLPGEEPGSAASPATSVAGGRGAQPEGREDAPALDMRPADAVRVGESSRSAALRPVTASLVEPEGDEDFEFGTASLLDAEEESAAAVPPTPPAAARAEGLEDLDVLPDLDALSDSFSAPRSGEVAAAVREDSASGSYARAALGGDAALGGAQRDTDPALLAQAVRTLLKRDQKG